MFEPWQSAPIDDAAYNGIRDEYINRLTGALLSTGITEIDRSTFEYHCRKCGIDPDNSTQGLIYFTDGYGVFSDREPDYGTEFVFARDTYEIPEWPHGQ